MRRESICISISSQASHIHVSDKFIYYKQKEDSKKKKIKTTCYFILWLSVGEIQSLLPTTLLTHWRCRKEETAALGNHLAKKLSYPVILTNLQQHIPKTVSGKTRILVLFIFYAYQHKLLCSATQLSDRSPKEIPTSRNYNIKQNKNRSKANKRPVSLCRGSIRVRCLAWPVSCSNNISETAWRSPRPQKSLLP